MTDHDTDYEETYREGVRRLIIEHRETLDLLD